MVPREIIDRYASGEREIIVSPETYAQYHDGLMTLYLMTPRERQSGHEPFLCYKDARVIRYAVPK